ncbi:hypothetical protein CC2G_013529 [Coprinopsis cinerea AmutBmut pab1-1]|nr:hypothetical protein CC2G_013529 [Coprinopsis cinerea AmutBmut pab1-1]
MTRGHRHYILTVSGANFHPLSTEITPLPDDPQQPTWSLKHTVLSEALTGAWDCLNPDTDEILSSVNALPAVDKGPQFPYSADGINHFTRELVGLQFDKRSGEDLVSCRCCDAAPMKLKHLRNHVGHHILRAFRGVPDRLKDDYKMGSNPCGWCAGNGCKTQLVLSSRGTYVVLSDCEFHYQKMVYSRAAEYSYSSPCTNVPIPCSLCLQADPERTHLPTFWKYNLIYHMISTHLSPTQTLPPFPPDMIVSCHITYEEESRIGIPQEKTVEYRDTLQVPGSDDVRTTEEGLKRDRSASSVSKPRPLKKSKTS